MDAMGVDRPTALVLGRSSALLGQVAVCLAERGYDVHLTPDVVPDLDLPGWTWRRLHVAPDGEQALLAAVAGRARPLEVAVIDSEVAGAVPGGGAAGELARAVATYQQATGRGRPLHVARTSRARRRVPVERALDDLLGATVRSRGGRGPLRRLRRPGAPRLLLDDRGPADVLTDRSTGARREVAPTDG